MTKAVDELHGAVLAAAGSPIPAAEIEAALAAGAAPAPARPTHRPERTSAMTVTESIPRWEHDDIIHGWWVIPGRLLAAEYPGAKNPRKAAGKIRTLVEAGITSFVDLTEAGEITRGAAPMVPYAGLLNGTARYRRFPIPDTGVISDAGYDRILAHIRAELAVGRSVVVHCWGGKGRTGTVVGAWLIEESGLGFPRVLDRMQELRAGTCKAHHRVPDTEEQDEVLRRRAGVRRGRR